MRLLSIDIGIKNLALCILETCDDNVDFIKINYWNIINLCDDDVKVCNYIKPGKPGKKTKECAKLAKFHNNEHYYCKAHCSKSGFIIPTNDLKKFKKLKLGELIDLAKLHGISTGLPHNKTTLVASIENYINNYQLLPIKTIKANDVDLIELGISIKKNLDKIDFTNIDCVLIENQIGPIANRMKCLQVMISQYFIMNNIHNIKFISSANKLKLFIEKKDTTYSERKKYGIQYCQDILEKNVADPKWLKYFKESKKSDDLADSFLQGVYILFTLYKKK